MDASSPRYARQRALVGLGAEGQERLAAAHVVVVGAGGLGSAVIPALAAAGVGELTIVDDDEVDVTNLHRQTLHSPADIGRTKAESAAEAVAALSPETVVHAEPVRFDAASALALILDADLLVDASDNTATRYLANDVAAVRGIPLVWGSAVGWSGQAGVAWDARGVDYRDLFPVEPDADPASCETLGVLPTVCTVIGGIMAGEALKLLTGSGEPLLGRAVEFDGRTGRTRELEYRREAGAPRPGSIEERTAERVPDETHNLTPRQLEALIASGEEFVLLDVREPHEAEIASLPGSVLIPLGELPFRIGELDSDAPTVVYCHHGFRSSQALGLLRAQGFAEAGHLTGGIDAWAREVDPSMARY